MSNVHLKKQKRLKVARRSTMKWEPEFVREERERAIAQTKKIEKLIRSGPWRSLDVADRVLDYAVELLDKLVEATPMGPAHVRTSIHPVVILCRAFHSFANVLVARAMRRDAGAVEQVWKTSSALIECIHSIAHKDPGLLKPFARSSLFLPSFRVDSDHPFAHDFDFVRLSIISIAQQLC